MRLFPLTLLATLLLSLVGYGQPPTPEPPLADGLIVPKRVEAEVYTIGSVRAETSGKFVVWRTPAKLFAKPSPDGKELQFAGEPGEYPTLVITAVGDRPVVAETVLVVKARPGPGPTPSPPASDLAAELQALFASDTSPAKATHLSTLVDLYDAATAKCDQKTIRTAGQLFDAVRGAAGGLLPTDALKGLRGRLGMELNAAVKFSPTDELTDERREVLKAAYTRCVVAMKAIK